MQRRDFLMAMSAKASTLAVSGCTDPNDGSIEAKGTPGTTDSGYH